MSDLVLRLDGFDVEGWTSVQVTRSLDALADTFDLQLTTAASSKPPPVDIIEGQACQILYGDEVLLSGYIDTMDLSYNATSTSLTVSGRSKAGDLVDCTAIKPGKVTGGSWRNTPFLTIANDITEPFGITCFCDLGDPLESHFKLTEGESCFDALERLGKDYGLRIVSFADGDIQYTRAGIETLVDVVIESGINVVSGGVTRSCAERFSDYLFKGQLKADDDNEGEVNTSHLVQDDGVGRYRPLLIETDEQVRNSKGQFTNGKNKSPLQLRAEWERNTRAGRSRQLTYDVCNPDDLSLSWEMPGHGALWRPNIIVTVLDDFLQIDGQYLVTSVTLVRDGSGTRTSLSLTFPEAYETELPPKKKKKKGFSW